MIEVLKSANRAISDHGHVAIRRTFSSDNPRDTYAGGFGALFSIAETTIAPSAGFPMHPHRDMEIISYMADGAMAHQDSLGNGSVIKVGEIQRMSAGTGIIHSEFNPSATGPCRCLQIWILPSERGFAPSYEQQAFDMRGGLTLIAAGPRRTGAVTIHQDVALYAARLGGDETAAHALTPGRRAYLQLARGRMMLNGVALEAGDGAAIKDEPRLTLTAGGGAAEALLFDIA